jgi:hypothetical protein
MGVLLIDNFLSLYYIDFELSNTLDVVVFPTIVSIFVVCQVFIIKQFIGRNKVLADIKKSDFITHVSIASTVLTSIVILVVAIQIVLGGYYYTTLIQAGIGISYIVSLIAFGFLIYRLLKWYKEDKEFIILVYAFAIISIVFRIISILLMESSLLVNSDFIRNFESIAFFAELEPNTLSFFAWQWYSICSIVSLMLLWLTNAVFLRNYYKKFSRFKYFILVILLPSFTMIDFVVNQSFVESGEIDPLLFDVIVLVSGFLAGVLLAIPYFIIARSIKDRNNNVRYQLVFVGLGLIIFVISGTAIIDHLPFPPFGFTSILAMQLASIIIYVSLYESAVSFSLDSMLRKSINKQMNGMADMLKKIGNSEMSRKMLENTIEAQQRIHDEMMEAQHIPPTMDNDKIREYIEIISEEIQQIKK